MSPRLDRLPRTDARQRRRLRGQFGSRGRQHVVVLLALFAVVSGGGVALSALVTAREQHQAVLVQVAARQRTLAERYVNDVLLRLGGRPADPEGTGQLLLVSGRALLYGGVAPAANGDDDEATLPPATDETLRSQIRQELRLIIDLIRTGDALLEGRSPLDLPTTGGEHSLPADSHARLRVLGVLTSNVSLNAARTIAANADRQVAQLIRLEVALGAAGLSLSVFLGWLLIAATRRQTAHFRSLVQSSTDLVVVLDEGGRCKYVSPSVTQLTGCEESVLIGAAFRSHVHPDDLADLLTLGSSTRSADAWLRFRVRAGQEWRDLEATLTDLRPDRYVRGFVLNCRDVTERVALEEQLNHLAFHDPLTGLANRALLRNRLDHALAKAARTGNKVAVLLTDLDEFKQVNDTLGHEVGDRLLTTIAERLSAVTRSGDTVARLGGDEFAIILEDTDERLATAAAQRIVTEAGLPMLLGGRHLVVGASVGVDMANDPATTGEQLIRNADIAMYAAKQGGGGRFEIFDLSLGRQAGEVLGLQHEIQSGLQIGEFVMHYQPEVSLADGRVLGVEALMRWNSPARGLVGPVAFIPAAESTSAILALGEFALFTACAQTAQWAQENPLPDGFRTWVNISAKQLNAGELCRTVHAALAAAKLPPSRLGIELTETFLVGNDSSIDQARRHLEELHEAGIHVAIDDFGTGYSSLSHLQRFPIDALKIDRSFVAGLEQRGKDSAIVSNVISLAHALGLTAIAEGVETEGQLADLRRLGCELGQGFLFARPAPPQAIAALLGARSIPSPRPAAQPQAVSAVHR